MTVERTDTPNRVLGVVSGYGTAYAFRMPVDDTRHLRFDLGDRSLREHVARGTLINGAFTIGLSALGLLRGFVIAAFLARSDYGVWGVLVISLGTLMWLRQMGIGDKYVQQDDENQEAAFQRAFTLEALVTGGTLILLAASLPLFAAIYGEPQIIVPGLVLLTTLPAGLLQMPLWWYTRRMQFLKLRIIRAIDPVVGFGVAVTLAASGAGYWAFVLAAVAGAWCTAAAALWQSPFPLRFRYDGAALRSYFGFSWPLVVTGGASMVIAQASLLATEARLGLAGAGAVALAATISQFSEQVDRVVTGTLYPAVCAVRNRMDLLFESFVKSNRLALLWAMPFGFGLVLYAPDIVRFWLGDEWRPAVIVMQAFGATAAIGHLGFNWDAYFRAGGWTTPMAIASVAAMAAFLIVGLPLLLAYGLPGLAAGVAVQMVVHVAFRAYFLTRLFSGFAMAGHALRAMAPTVPAVLLTLGVRGLTEIERTLPVALAELVLYVSVVALTTWWFEGRLLREATGYLRARPVAAAAA